MKVIQHFSAYVIRRFVYFQDGLLMYIFYTEYSLQFYELFIDNVHTYNDIITFEAVI